MAGFRTSGMVYPRLPTPGLIGLLALGASALAHAGIPECNNIRLEDVTNGGCELRASGQCSASCDRLGVYKKACATKLHTVCREDCTLSAQPTCSDSCTVSCQSECDRGVSITCQHNCFNECHGSCDARCEGAADAAQCRATCEATCDGECDIQCRPVVDGDCYTHCIECCGGSCKAQANMDCQTTCQEQEFEDCEHELEIDCSASCDIDGALFCGGEFILSGQQLPSCVQALIARGTLTVDAEAQAEVSLGSLPKAKGGCALPSLSVAGSAPSGAVLALLGVLGVALRQRARRRGAG
ncbi:MAG: hypothetical protein RL685_2945 [Pseudomonadota bacterium]|jgi:hypothetical protein